MTRSKNQLVLSILTILIIATLIPVASSAPTKVISVPWQGDINKYHATWSGQEIILKGVIHTDTTDPIWYKWNLGDGTPESVVNTLSGKTQYNVEIKHTYTGAEETPFIAKLIVADNDALVNPIEDPYLVKIQAANLDSKINVAIDNGLWFLYKSGSDGSGYYHTFDNSPFMVWSYSSYYASPTASAVHAFEINGHKETGNPDEDPYVESVERGLNWLFNGYWSNTNFPMLKPTNIGVTPNGDDPDTNGNGIGIGVRDYGNNPVYESGMVMDAIVASGTPDADSGRDFNGDGVNDTYREVLQDMADMYAWGQNDGGNHKGGWRYSWNFGSSDNSISQWAAIGMIPAQESPWNVQVPQWVKDYNNDPWTKYSYNQWTSGGVTYGGFGYASNSPIWGYHAVTPSGLIQLAFSGQTTSDYRWGPSERWLADNWNTWRNSENVYAYYAFAKAMRVAKPDPVVTFSSNNFDWYRGDGITMGLAEKVANRLVSNSNWNYYGTNLGTAWSIIILRPVLFQEAPIGRFDADPNPSYPDKPINFDPSGSDHSQADKDIDNLVLFEWDWNNDGVYDESTNTPEKVTHPFSCPSIPCTYPVKLKVTDDNDPARTSTYVMNIQITYPPHPPVANAGGPYFVSLSPGDVLILDGSESYDPNEGLHETACLTCPDDTITAWEWDLNGAPWDYTDKNGEVVDLSSDITTYFPVAGGYNIGLRTKDRTTTSYPTSGDPDLTDEDFDVVHVFEDIIGEVNAVPFCNAVSLSWADVGADHYDIYRSFLDENSGYQYIGSTTDNTKFAGSFVMDKDHWYRIMAVTGDNEALSQAVKVNGEPSLCNPIANPGGPYEGNVGEAIKLDGSGSAPKTGVIVTWEWDLDNDGLYDDAFGESIHWVWDSPGVYDIGLQVTSSDSLVLKNEGFTTVDIKPQTIDFKVSNIKPVQVVWDAKINNDDKIDLVAGKSTMIQYDIGINKQSIPEKPISVKISFDGKTYTNTVDLIGPMPPKEGYFWNTIQFYPDAGKPSNIGDQIITIEIDPGVPESNKENNQDTEPITVRGTKDIRIDYASIIPVPFVDSFNKLDVTKLQKTHLNGNKFILATYPIRDSGIKSNFDDDDYTYYQGFPSIGKGGALLDLHKLDKIALIKSKKNNNELTRIVAVVDESYFVYHNYCNEEDSCAGGITYANPPGASNFGFAEHAAIVKEGYYSIPAHEIGHTFGLHVSYSNFGKLVDKEEYHLNDDGSIYPGNLAKGFWVNWLESGKRGKNIDDTYLFSWDSTPGNDDSRFIEFLNKNFDIDWVKTAKIEKIDNDKTIKVYTENNDLTLKLNNDQTEVDIEIDDDRTGKLLVKIENSKINIYEPSICFMGTANLNGKGTFDRWIDNTDYAYLFNQLEKVEGKDPNILLVSGFIDKEDKIDLDEWYYLENVVIDDIQSSGEYSVEFLDKNGEKIDENKFGVSFILLADPIGPIDIDTTHFLFPVVYPENTYKVQIKHNENILIEINPNSKLLHDAVDLIPDHGFINNPEQRRKALHNKIDAVEKQMEEGEITGARNKLEFDIKDKLEKWLIDDYQKDTLQYSKDEIIDLADQIIRRLDSI